MSLNEACTKFVKWLDDQVLFCARRDNVDHLDVEPKGRFWLGRLAPEEAVIESSLDERGERLEPCAVGVRAKLTGDSSLRFKVIVKACVWTQNRDEWIKLSGINEVVNLEIDDFSNNEYHFGQAQLEGALTDACSAAGLSCELRVELRQTSEHEREITSLLVNTSPKTHSHFRDTNLYEASLDIDGLKTKPFILEALPDSFRYDRRVPAYGINCGVMVTSPVGFRTTDTVSVDTPRRKYWSLTSQQPDFNFELLSKNPMPSLNQLTESHGAWGKNAWSSKSLGDRALQDNWSSEMRVEAERASQEFWSENARLRAGIQLLESSPQLLEAFELMNSAMSHAANGRYDSWRPFQVGFLLANLQCITDEIEDVNTVDVVWFATGGGKTETYLGLLITAALYERMRGKLSGITAWSRFPLRMLSLQQTQRFADAMAGAEIVRRQANIPGDPFSVGFFVGEGATPNSLKEEAEHGAQYDVEDEGMPGRCRVLLKCPFCHSDSVSMYFNRRYWRLEHQCTNDDCPWPEQGLPFYVVDDEIYRFLPTVIVGTLDKAASISMNAGMRGFVGSPLGMCSENGHGYVYAPRSSRPNGCLVPGCIGTKRSLPMMAELYAPAFRLQDELHLLKDSLGAVDSHYESLFDELQFQLSGRRPKVLASSATLTGYDRQIRLLYQRDARVFPVPGPSANEGFWTSASEDLARRFIAVAPRGVTIEYTVDKTLTEIQGIIRRLQSDPNQVCHEAGIDSKYANDLVLLYGVDVVYGSTLRDLDAVARSLETQVSVEGSLNTASLTGRTQFDEVRATLGRLQSPETDFNERLHVITASSMMSHGVDIDRLNVMVMLGIPLSTSEFIQATARIGRSWPGSIYVMQKMARERDAGVFRCFEKFVAHGDRFVEPIPITRRSRRVLEKTVAGIYLARILAIHEATSKEALTTVSKLRDYFSKAHIGEDSELAVIVEMLKFANSSDEPLQRDLKAWMERFFDNLKYPGGSGKFPSDLSPTGKPMRSLRDVEVQIPILGH